MSKTALVVALLVAIALGVSAWIMTSNTPSTAGAGDANGQNGAALSFDPSAIRALTVTTADRGTHTLIRTDAGAWVHVPGADIPADAERVGWPVLPERARTAVTTLASLESLGAPDDSAAISDTAAVARIQLSDGTEHKLEINPDALGGRTLARVNADRYIFMDAAIAASLTKPGPVGWRVPWALPGVREASRLTVNRLEDDPMTIELRRVDGRWGMIQPAAVRANTGAVSGLQNVLADIQIEQFVEAGDQPGFDVTGLDTPSMIIRAETDTRRPVPGTMDVQVTTRVRELHIGAAANVEGSRLYASPDPAGSLLFTIPADRVYGVSTAPRAYLAVTASGTPIADVFGIDITGDDFSRSLRLQEGAWYEDTNSAGRGIPVETQAAMDILNLVTRQPGEADLAEAGAISKPVTIRLLDRSDQPLDVMTMGHTAEGTLVIINGSHMLKYGNVNMPALLPQRNPQASAPVGGAGGYNK